MKTILRDHAIYFAGLFDGEGCVNICERKPHYGGPGQVTPTFRCELSLANTHHGVMLHIIEAVGGNLFKMKRLALKKNGQPRRAVWRWSAGQAESHHILTQIVPFLIVKRKQASLALTYWDSINQLRRQSHPGRIGKLRTSPEEIESRRQFVCQMQALNHPK
jgi:hypothetical protein